MISWKLILDDDAILKRINPERRQANQTSEKRNKSIREIREYKNTIDQHRIVYSDSFGDLLFKKYGEIYQARFQEFIDSECDAYNKYKINVSNCDTFGEWISQAISCLPDQDWFVIYNNDESIKNIDIADNKRYTFQSVLEKSYTNQVHRNSPDFKFRAINGNECQWCHEWFRELFHDESKIIIFDLYFMKYETFRAFEEYMAPHIESGTEVWIYTDKQLYNQYLNQGRGLKDKTICQRLRHIAKSRGLVIKIFTAEKKDEKEHDRHIFLSSGIHVTIGKGIDFINFDKKKIEGTDVGIYEGDDATPESIQKEYAKDELIRSTYIPTQTFR